MVQKRRVGFTEVTGGINRRRKVNVYNRLRTEFGIPKSKVVSVKLMSGNNFKAIIKGNIDLRRRRR